MQLDRSEPIVFANAHDFCPLRVQGTGGERILTGLQDLQDGQELHISLS
jgi:hypothetical protein